MFKNIISYFKKKQAMIYFFIMIILVFGLNFLDKSVLWFAISNNILQLIIIYLFLVLIYKKVKSKDKSLVKVGFLLFAPYWTATLLFGNYKLSIFYTVYIFVVSFAFLILYKENRLIFLILKPLLWFLMTLFFIFFLGAFHHIIVYVSLGILYCFLMKYAEKNNI